jgi:translation initiation factor IF-1
MVKNTQGGSKHKSMARKSVNAAPSAKLRIPEEDGECFACVTRMTGNGMCKVDVWYNDGILSDVTCFIRGKFKSKSKKQNLVSKDSFIIVGLRLWSSDLTKCDLLEVFQANNIHELSSISSSFKLFSFAYLNSTPNITYNTSENIIFNNHNNNVDISIYDNLHISNSNTTQHEHDHDDDFNLI